MQKFSADRLRKALQSAGITATAAADAAGLNGSTISRYLSGDAVPGANAIAALAEVTGLAIGHFFTDEHEYTHGAPDAPAA